MPTSRRRSSERLGADFGAGGGAAAATATGAPLEGSNRCSAIRPVVMLPTVARTTTRPAAGSYPIAYFMKKSVACPGCRRHASCHARNGGARSDESGNAFAAATSGPAHGSSFRFSVPIQRSPRQITNSGGDAGDVSTSAVASDSPNSSIVSLGSPG